jgi:hypothetical protein
VVARYGNTITKTTGAAAAPIATLGASTTRDPRVYEVCVSVSTAVSGEVGLMRPANTPAGGSGGQVGAAMDTSYAAGLATTANAWTTAPTVGTAFRRMVLPATIGAGVIWTFPQGLVVPVSGFLVVWQFSALAVTYSVSFDYEE